MVQKLRQEDTIIKTNFISYGFQKTEDTGFKIIQETYGKKEGEK